MKIFVNGKLNNLGVDGKLGLEISWLYKGAYKTQTEYCVTIFKNHQTIFTSGKVKSGKTFITFYPLLQSLAKYNVLVETIADNKNLTSKTSFETSFVDEKDFCAKWIEGGLLLKIFSLEKRVRFARLYITGLGYYHTYINGKKVGDLYAAPGYTTYAKAIEYQIFDITNYLKNENRWVIITGEHFDEKTDTNRFYSKTPCAFAELIIEYENGEKKKIITDSTFLKSLKSPFLKTSIYNGEKFDARILPNFENGEFEINNCRNVNIVTSPTKELFAERCEGVKIVAYHNLCKIYKITENKYTLDFGVNRSGVVKIKGKAKSGAKITLHHAELLKKDNTIDSETCRIAQSTDEYIFSGIGEEEYMPRFTYHGFRYVEITLDGVNIENLIFEMAEIRSALKTKAIFECSDVKINKIHTIMKQTLSNNLYSIPTDCPQRDERQGWLGDAQIASTAVLTAFESRWFYKNYMQEIARGQNEDGSFTEMCAPAFVGGATLLYTGAYFLIAENVYRESLDLEIIRPYYQGFCSFYESLKQYETDNKKGMIIDVLGVGDWLGQYSSEGHSALAVFAHIAESMADFSIKLGYNDKAEYFKEEFLRLKEKYNKLYYYVTPNKTGAYGDCNEQSEYINAISICYHLEPDGEKQAIWEYLANEVEFSRGEPTLTTGLLGTKYLFDALRIIGRNDLALKLFERDTYPSWGFMLKKGATTIWERWEYLTRNNMNSHCHTPLAAPLTWLYKGLSGIGEPKEDEFGNIIYQIMPMLSSLKKTKASIITNQGNLSVSVKKLDGKYNIELVVPPVTICELQGVRYGVGKHFISI